MKYQGIIKGSRTIDLTAVTAAIGAALTALPQLQAIIKPEYYGIAFMVLSVAFAYLRKITTKPLGDKSTGDPS